MNGDHYCLDCGEMDCVCRPCASCEVPTSRPDGFCEDCHILTSYDHGVDYGRPAEAFE